MEGIRIKIERTLPSRIIAVLTPVNMAYPGCRDLFFMAKILAARQHAGQ